MPKRLSEELRDGGVQEGLRESSSLGDIEASICARVAAVSAAAGCELLKSNQTLAAASSASTCSKQSCSIERVLTKRAPPDVSAQTVAKTNCAPAIPPELRTTTQPSGNTNTRRCAHLWNKLSSLVLRLVLMSDVWTSTSLPQPPVRTAFKQHKRHRANLTAIALSVEEVMWVGTISQIS